jgi:hypothetical protein
MEQLEKILPATGTILGGVGICLSVNDIQTIMSIVATCLSIITSIIFTIIKVVDKYKKAKEDGVITSEEQEDINKTIKEGTEEVSEKVKELEDKTKSE